LINPELRRKQERERKRCGKREGGSRQLERERERVQGSSWNGHSAAVL